MARHQLADGRQAAARGEGTGSRPHILDNTLVCVIVDHEYGSNATTRGAGNATAASARARLPACSSGRSASSASRSRCRRRAWPLRDLDPWVVAFGRALVAAVLAGGLLRATRAPWPSRAQWRSLAIVAAGVVVGFPLLTSLALASPHVGARRDRRRPRARRDGRDGGASRGGAAEPGVLGCERRRHRGRAGVRVRLGSGRAARQPTSSCSLAVVLVGLGYAEGGALARDLGGTRTICWALVLSAPLLLPVVALRLAQTGFHVHADSAFGFAYVATVSMFARVLRLVRGPRPRRRGAHRADPARPGAADAGLGGAVAGERVTVGSALTAVLVVRAASPPRSARR